MKATKRAVILISLLAFAPKIFWPQEASSDGGAAAASQEVSISQESPQDQNAPQESSQAQETPGEKSSRRTAIKKAKGLVKEFNEKKESEQNDGPVNAVQFMGDFLTDKLPLTLDLGAEPGEDGSLIFASLQYDWRDRFASRVRLEYKSSVQINDTASGYEKVSAKSYGIDLYPAIWYFGDTSADSQDALWALGLGAGYSFNDGHTFTCGASWTLLWMDAGIKYHLLGPVISASVQKPLGRFFCVGAELDVQPIFGVFLNMAVKSNLTQNNGGRFSYYSATYASPSLSQSFWLDVLKYIRLKAVFRYSRVALETVRFDSLSGNFYLRDIINNEISARGGVEIVLPSTNKTRKKHSHLWAGVYYQHTWTVNEYAGETARSDMGKWVICFGK